MDTKRGLDNRRNNRMYYNQLVRENKVRQGSSQRHSSESVSFSSKKVNLSKHVFVVEGYEEIFYTFYFFTVPYVIGAVFLFFFIADGKYEHFMLLNFNAFLIVWMIGYEIVASLILAAIFFSFFKHNGKPKKRR